MTITTAVNNSRESSRKSDANNAVISDAEKKRDSKSNFNEEANNDDNNNTELDKEAVAATKTTEKKGKRNTRITMVDLDNDYDDKFDDEDDNLSITSSNSTLSRLLGKVNMNIQIQTEITPPKSLVIIWILMAVELGFDLITTAIAFFSSIGKEQCCDHVVSLGPLPMTTTIPFFLLIVAEMTFLSRAILLTLWPSIFETRRLECHGPDANNDGIEIGDDDDDNSVGFEVELNEKVNDNDNNNSDDDGEKTDDEVVKFESASSTAASVSSSIKPTEEEKKKIDKVDVEEKRNETLLSSSLSKDETCTDDNNKGSDKNNHVEGMTKNEIDIENIQELYKNEVPHFIDGRNNNSSNKSKQRETTNNYPSWCGTICSYFKRTFCCFLRWNAKMVLFILNFLTLLNPFFGCLIAWILLYQSDKTESFVVLGMECISIILHFVSVRMEGGLRTWYSKAIHSVALLPFFVTVILVLTFLREGGMCYSVEKEMFLFSGCEVCPDTYEPPDSNGMCTTVLYDDMIINNGDGSSMIEDIFGDDNDGNITTTSSTPTSTTITYSLEGVSGGFLNQFQNIGSSVGSMTGFNDMKNSFASLIQRGADQDTFCSPDLNFCFYKFDIIC